MQTLPSEVHVINEGQLTCLEMAVYVLALAFLVVTIPLLVGGIFKSLQRTPAEEMFQVAHRVVFATVVALLVATTFFFYFISQETAWRFWETYLWVKLLFLVIAAIATFLIASTLATITRRSLESHYRLKVPEDWVYYDPDEHRMLPEGLYLLRPHKATSHSNKPPVSHPGLTRIALKNVSGLTVPRHPSPVFVEWKPDPANLTTYLHHEDVGIRSALTALLHSEEHPNFERFASTHGVIFTHTPPPPPPDEDPLSTLDGLMDKGRLVQQFETRLQELLGDLADAPPEVRARVKSMWDKAVNKLVYPR